MGIECDRSFTRSDALTKHIRTVHEPDPARAGEQVAKPGAPGAPGKRGTTPIESNASPQPPTSATGASSTMNKPPQRLKLILSSSKAREAEASTTTAEPSEPVSPVSPSSRDLVFGTFPSDCHFASEELALPRKELYRLLRRQIAWATEIGAELRRDNIDAEEHRRQEFIAKEYVLENLMEAEFERADLDLNFRRENAGVRMEMRDITLQAKDLPVIGKEEPWYRSRRDLLMSKENDLHRTPRADGTEGPPLTKTTSEDRYEDGKNDEAM